MIPYKISIILPTHNSENYLKDSTNSIINQTIGFSNLELIIIDDYSTDNTKNMINNLTEKYPNCKSIFLKKASGSGSKPRNIGIENATSEYIMFIDDDDEYEEEACELFFKTIKKTKENIVFSNTTDIYENKEYLEFSFDEDKCFNINLKENQNFLMKFNAPWAKIYRKSYLDENNIRFSENTLPDDAIFYIKTIINSNNIPILTKPLYKHFVRETDGNNKSQTNSYSINRLNKHTSMIKEINEIIKNEPSLGTNIMDVYLTVWWVNFININSKLKDKKILENLYEIENKFNYEIKISTVFESKLNKLLLNKKFKSIIFISNLIKTFYSPFIKKIYRKMLKSNDKKTKLK